MSDWAILDENKKVVKVDMHTANKWLKNNSADKKIVARTELPFGVVVSTVFLPLNHGWSPFEELWFETMVFGGPWDLEMDRYKTYEDALRGHEEIVERVKKPKPQDE